MKNLYLGNFAIIKYIGEDEKEFRLAPFYPKPIVKKGDMVTLSYIDAYNVVKLLPDEWELFKSKIELENTLELEEKLEEANSYILELESAVAKKDLEAKEDEILEDEIKITPDEALEFNELLELENFSTKEELENYAFDNFQIKLDKRKSLDKMYEDLKESLGIKE